MSVWTILKQFDQSQTDGTIIGTDEAGRGPLAGPVVAAAVVLDYRYPLDDLNDSKKLSAGMRLELFNRIVVHARDWAIALCTPEEIDRLNILRASLKAMALACGRIKIQPDLVLVDGNQSIPRIDVPQSRLIKGDARSAAIAAASILAKVSRDYVMDYYHSLYPEYEFNHHKGYPTARHIQILRQLGPCPIHRRSFTIKSSFSQPALF
ncbi:MAG: ribonuclease HII [Candidatus Delongbacteria bacterium]|nr:ribonuclease HII [Candidatus Delongbacteria bacterium]